MTDKVQKIREWVEARLGENTSKQSLPQFYGMMEEDARFLDFLDSLQDEPVSEDLSNVAKEYANSITEKIGYRLQLRRAVVYGAKWQKEQIIKRLCNHANIDQMVEKFEDKYKPQNVLDTEYYKRGIFDTIKTIKED